MEAEVGGTGSHANVSLVPFHSCIYLAAIGRRARAGNCHAGRPAPPRRLLSLLQVAALLQKAGAHSAKAVAEAEEALAMKELTVEEARERQNRLAKMRALLFYHEVGGM